MGRSMPAGWLRRAQEARAEQVRAQAAKRSRWFCEHCGTGGVVPYAADAGVFEVAGLIADAHQEASPACASTFGNLHVRAGVA